MVDRKQVEAGDQAGGTMDNDQGAPQSELDSLLGLSAEEQAQFAEMQQNAGRPAVIESVEDGADADSDGAAAGEAEAAAQRAAAATGDNQPGAGQDGQKPAQGKGDDDEDDDVGDDPTQGGKFPQRVNYQKYQRARTKAQKAEDEARTLREQLARTDERYKLIVEALKTPDQGAPGQPGAQQQQTVEEELGPMPNPNEDIVAFGVWQAKKNEILERELQQLKGGVTQQNEEATLKAGYQTDIQQFMAKTPDFGAAYNRVMETRIGELALQWHGLNIFNADGTIDQEKLRPLGKAAVDQIAQQVEADERLLAKNALKAGRSPAEQIYNMAFMRGYRKEAAPANGQQNGAGQHQNGAANGNGAVPAVTNGNGNGQQQARSPVSEAVAAAKRGVQTNQTLSTGGGAPEGMLTREQVMSMPDDDFAQFMETASKEQLRAVFGA